MVTPASVLSHAASGLGLRPLNASTFYGMAEGWPVLLGNFVLTVCTSDGAASESDRLKAADPAVKKVRFKDGRLIVWFRGKTKELCPPIIAVLRTLTSLGYAPTPACPVCGEEYCDCAVYLNGAYRLSHRSCIADLAAKADSDLKNSAKKGSVLLGILGAFIGMLVGTIPNILSILAAEMEYSILFALIPICAYFGYKLLGGKMKKPIPLVVSVIMSVLGVFMLIFEVTTIFAMKEYGIEANEFFHLLGLLMADPERWSSILTESFQEFLFTALGVWVAWRTISSTPAQNKQNTAAAARMTMYVLPGAADTETISENNETI